MISSNKTIKNFFFMFCILIINIVTSCSNKHKEETTPDLKPVVASKEHNLLTLHFFKPYTFYNLSLPYWFNDYLVQNKAIESISITVYDIVDNEIDSLFPSCKHVFKFDDNGSVKFLSNTTFHQGVSLGTEEFEYNQKSDNYGIKTANFKGVKNKQYDRGSNTTLFDELQNLAVYQSFEHTKKEEDYVVYHDILHPNEGRKVYLNDTSDQNIMTVDALQKKYGTMRVCYGTPMLPETCFEVEDLVKRTNFIRYSYTNDMFPLKITQTEGLFNIVTTFDYDSIGRLVTYHNTTLSPDQSEIKNERWEVSYNEKDLPKTLTLFNKDNEALKTKQFNYLTRIK